MLIPTVLDTAKPDTSAKGAILLPDAVDGAKETFFQIMDQEGRPILDLVKPVLHPDEQSPATETQEDLAGTHTEADDDTPEIAIGEEAMAILPPSKHRFGSPDSTPSIPLRTTDKRGPMAPVTGDNPAESAELTAQSRPQHSVTETRPTTRAHLGHDLSAHLPNNTSPTATGSKGPIPISTQAEEPDMQLTRPSRMRSFHPAVTRTALAHGTVPPVSDGVENAPMTLKAVSPVVGTDDAPEDAPRAQTSRWPGASEQASQARQIAKPPAPVTGTVAGPPIATAQMARFLHSAQSDPAGQTATGPEPRTAPITPPIPQVLAAYSSLSPRSATQPDTKAARADDIAAEVSLARSHDLPTGTDAAKAIAKPAGSNISPEQLATQLSQIAQNAALQRRDILLNPEELGRIRMNVNAHDQSVHVAILVERPETLDLMRRYINQLTQEFRALGYQDVSFDFAQQQRDGTQAEPAQAQSTEAEITPEAALEPVALPPQRTQPTGLLDLRI